jgi:N-acetylmuramoyl-L-alanine amidase
VKLLAALVSTALAALAFATPPASGAPAPQPPLAGVVIALDPGHQLGNSNPKFASQMAQTRFNGGYPEATFTWRVTRYLENRLITLGATVRKTRSNNSYDAWGPCVWNRGKFGAEVGADLMVSVHADGAAPSGSGFYVMLPSTIAGWTDDIAKPSARMGKRFIQGMADAGAPRSTYISGQTLVTPEISTLNFSDVPVILVELGNMRNDSDAARMTSREGQKQYADWLVAGIRAALRK